MTLPSRIETIAAFRSERLNNERNIYVYLPPDYDRNTDQSYPVLYAHDGQNVFASAYNGQTWSLHTITDRLIADGRIEEIIIVAVDNAGPGRNSEFAHEGPLSGKLDYACRGEAYEQFLTEELKPWIDRTYRTKPDSANTALMGSSRGGLVTYHIGFRRPDVFGKLAMISPYFAQYNEADMSHFPIVQLFDAKRPLRLWIDTGGMEGMIVLTAHVRSMAEHFIKLGYRPGDDLMFGYEPLAEHNEDAWRQRVHAPLLYFFGGTVGKPVSAELAGDDRAGITGAGSYVYPIVQYESGLKAVDLFAEVAISPADSASVTSGGHIKAAKPGECTIRYERGGLTASRTLRIVPEISAKAAIDIEVKVPADTPAGARIYAGVELERRAPQTYGRRFVLPRGTGFSFSITEFSGLREAGPGGRDIPKRRFVADRDLTLRYEVESWIRDRHI